MSDSLRLPLEIDFGRFDADLRKVADRIEGAGKNVPIGLETKVATGGADADDLAEKIGGLGDRLAAGLSAGANRAQPILLGLGAHMNTMFDRFAGAAITMFRRMDAEMKFEHVNKSFRDVRDSLAGVGTSWKSLNLRGLIQSDLVDSLGRAAGQSAAAANPARLIANGWTSVAAKVREAQKALGDAKKAQEEFAALAAASNAPLGPGRTNAATGSRVAGAGRQVPLAGMGAAPVLPKFGAFMAAAVAAANGVDRIRAAAAAAAPTLAVVGRYGAAGLKAIAATADVATIALAAPIRVAALLGAGITELARKNWNLRSAYRGLGDVAGKTYRSLYEQTGILHKLFISLPVGLVKLGAKLLALPFRVFRRGESDAKGFTKAVGESRTSVGQLSGAVGGTLSKTFAAFGLVGASYKIADWLKDGVKGASDLNEAVSRSQVVFGQAFGPVDAQAKKMAAAFGLSHQAQLDVASGYGAMASGAGFSEGAASSLANQMTALAGDLSSSVNISFEEAGAKIRSALAGEAEPLRQFGANISEANVKAYALAHGLATSSGAISDQAKITARAALISEGLAYAQGDLERTADSAANQFRKAGGGLAEFGVRIGQLLLPAVQAGASAFNDLLAATLATFESSLPTIQRWGERIGQVVGFAGRVARNLGDYFTITKLRVGEFTVNTIRWIETLPANFGIVTSWIGRNWWELLTDLVGGLATVGTNLVTNAASLGQAIWKGLRGEGFDWTFTPLLEGFQAASEALPDMVAPELLSVQKEVDEVLSRIAAREAARTAKIEGAGATAPRKPPGPVGADAAGDKKTPEFRLAGAAEVGSREAYSAVSRNNATGAGARSVQATTVDNSRATRENTSALRDVRQALGRQTAARGAIAIGEI